MPDLTDQKPQLSLEDALGPKGPQIAACAIALVRVLEQYSDDVHAGAWGFAKHLALERFSRRRELAYALEDEKLVPFSLPSL